VREASSASIHVSPGADATTVAPTDPVVVSAESGRLTQVVLHGPQGDIPGELSVDGRTWTAQSGSLEYATAYTYTATAVDRLGLRTDLTGTIKTVKPSRFLGYTISPRQDGTVGVGMPITLTLDRKLRTDDAKASFEKTLVVTVDGAPVDGAWRWTSNTTVSYRPHVYWPGNAEVSVSAALKGTRIADTLWGERDRVNTFRTAAAMVSYVDMTTDQMRVTKDGVLVRTIPITTGKVGFETRSGVKVIMGKERTRLMDAATGGTDPNDPEYYRLEVEYAMRVTNSGEFLHAAPWSVAHQGKENVSHGCTGMSTVNAAWLYANSRVGDVVVYTGDTTHVRMTSGNGIGVWNLSWSTWREGSALDA
jgi:lipoprotein-anchoring transpeptidase ErfK/SrfK